VAVIIQRVTAVFSAFVASAKVRFINALNNNNDDNNNNNMATKKWLIILEAE